MRYLNYAIYLSSNVLRKLGVDFHEQHDARVMNMRKRIAELGGKIEFDIEVDSETGEWSAESVNLEGIITGGKNYNPKSVNETLKDAIFTYFDIPPHLCNEALLRHGNEPVMARQKVYA